MAHFVLPVLLFWTIVWAILISHTLSHVFCDSLENRMCTVHWDFPKAYSDKLTLLATKKLR